MSSPQPNINPDNNVMDASRSTRARPTLIVGCMLAGLLAVLFGLGLTLIINTVLNKPTPKTDGNDNQAQIAAINSFFRAGAAGNTRDMYELFVSTSQAEYNTDYLRGELVPKLSGYQNTFISQTKCTAARVCTLTGNFNRQNQTTTAFTIRMVEVNLQWRILSVVLQ